MVSEMNVDIKISVIVPVYNIEKYLVQALNSIINQTFKDFEVICVNDGSKDNSLEILEKFAQTDNRFAIFSQKNSGSGMARNNGLSNAKGKYVIFLDGDDYFEPTLLEKLYNLAETHCADIAVCSSRKVDEDGNITETGNPLSPLNLDKIRFNKVFNYTNCPQDIFNLTGNIPWNKLYRTKMLIENNLKFPQLTGPDDFCFVHMANICAMRIVAIPDELINYRYNRAGSVQTYRANHSIDIIKAGMLIKEFLKKKNLYETLKPAYEKLIINATSWEISLCNKEQYQNFLNELDKLMPDSREEIEKIVNKSITPNYLKDFIGKKKVFFWGASIYIQNILQQEKVKNPNILGIIDKNSASWGKDFCGYKIFSPDILKNTSCDGVLLTVYRENETVYNSVKNELKQKYPAIKLLPNIFKGEN
jgi:glycosyltransferase involved in cell wall biosynthesis